MRKFITAVTLGIGLSLFAQMNALTAPELVPPWPNTVMVSMSWLDPDLGGASANTPCQYGDTVYGCTAFCTGYGSGYCEQSEFTATYPYSSSVVAVPIETYYILNVVSQEMSPEVYNLTNALEAQAIASRSYAGWFINNTPDELNNSSARQVFIPYRFDSLNPAANLLEPKVVTPCVQSGLSAMQQQVCGAVASGIYIARSDVDVPAFAEFSTDAYLQTVSNEDDRNNDGKRDFTYLTAVTDPISYDPAILSIIAATSAHQRGMSQGGANRWLHGNSSQYGDGDPWSVQWDPVEYVLTHYYTGIHLRNNAGERLTPDHRWVPLRIDWRTPQNEVPTFYYGQSYSITFEIQNTGVLTWSVGEKRFALRALWLIPIRENATPSEAPQSHVSAAPSSADEANYFHITHPVAPGGSISGTIILHPPRPSSSGEDYVLYFEMARFEYGPGDWAGFGELEAGLPWPRYEIHVNILRPVIAPVFLPLVSRNGDLPTERSRQ